MSIFCPCRHPPTRLDNNHVGRASFLPRPGASFPTDRIHTHPREPGLVPVASASWKGSRALCPSVTHLFGLHFTKVHPCCLGSGLIPRCAHSPLTRSVPVAGPWFCPGFCRREQRWALHRCAALLPGGLSWLHPFSGRPGRAQARGCYPSRGDAAWFPRALRLRGEFVCHVLDAPTACGSASLRCGARRSDVSAPGIESASDAHIQAFTLHWESQKTNFQPFITSKRNIMCETINASSDGQSVSPHTGTLASAKPRQGAHSLSLEFAAARFYPGRSHWTVPEAVKESPR